MIRYLRCPSVCERYGISRSTLYSWIQQGLFPAPIKLGPRAVGWAVAALDEWENERRSSTPDALVGR